VASCRPEHDAILRAGFARCTRCERIALPVDAAGLPDGLILVSYPAVCGDVPATAMVVDPGLGLDPYFPLEVYLPVRAGLDLGRYRAIELYLPGRRCAGHTRSGRRCRSPARPGSRYCPHHPHQAGETTA